MLVASSENLNLATRFSKHSLNVLLQNYLYLDYDMFKKYFLTGQKQKVQVNKTYNYTFSIIKPYDLRLTEFGKLSQLHAFFI